MAKYDQSKPLPVPKEVILSGLARIITTALLIPFDVFQIRLRYPDTWLVAMFRRMVRCKGCPGPYEALTASMLQRRTLSYLKWGVYYCLYDAHRKSCVVKGLNPLYQGTFLLTSRPVVTNLVQLGAFAATLDYLHERKRARERKVVASLAKGIRLRVYSVMKSSIVTSVQKWPLDTLKTRLPQLFAWFR